MKVLGGVLALIVALCVIDELSREDPIGFKQVEYEITEIKPPPNLKLSFKGVADGLVYSDIFIARACGGWKRIKPDDRIWLTEATFQKGDGVEKRLRDPASLIQLLYCRT